MIRTISAMNARSSRTQVDDLAAGVPRPVAGSVGGGGRLDGGGAHRTASLPLGCVAVPMPP